jgi:hypothetical protein
MPDFKESEPEQMAPTIPASGITSADTTPSSSQGHGSDAQYNKD